MLLDYVKQSIWALEWSELIQVMRPAAGAARGEMGTIRRRPPSQLGTGRWQTGEERGWARRWEGGGGALLSDSLSGHTFLRK